VSTVWWWARGHRTLTLSLVKWWPLRLLPVHVAAAFAAVEPDKAMYYGLYLATLTLLLDRRLRRPELPDMLAGALALWAAAAAIGSGAEFGVKSAGNHGPTPCPSPPVPWSVHIIVTA
jgi:hypothetical protein